ncbi:fumarylacetoacetate hydrolase family protein [Variovorax sp. J22G21]|uniref:fumarylacetoacetate hydrolase family protein n=1 Tax=Variovorax fucosicus TaxID=3053517 RepID=UPI002576A1D6|nr:MULTISPECIES: fumarylacetoacetate hydrolase family protein [unclassified Variovorax]MDM0040028.1 fumarylacetoacetate hydrolase family protein [Variovorax sp. J22R193]MDM0061401.1 fumarylacetoacetate hydrolase family protein [Variovorax sp. J22G21]
MKYAIAPATIPTLAIAGIAERFPVNRIFCVGRNYAAHAREMGKDPDRDPPFFFMKPANAAVDASAPVDIGYPPKTQNFHHEIELVVAIGTGGKDIAVGDALNHVYGYATGLDMTRRDLQLDARDKGRPWEFGKSFAGSAPIGALSRAADVGHIGEGAISVTVNGAARQSSDVAKLIWSVSECIAYLSEYETLEPGDLIMTGTPEGVNAVVAGDVMQGDIAGLAGITVSVRA